MQVDRDRGRRPVFRRRHRGSVSTGGESSVRGDRRALSREGVWFYVDGAYGAWPRRCGRAGIWRASRPLGSRVIRHKCLYARSRQGAPSSRSNTCATPLLIISTITFRTVSNFGTTGRRTRRGFRALKVWLGCSTWTQRVREHDRRRHGALARCHADGGRDPQLEAMTTGLAITDIPLLPVDMRSASARRAGRLPKPAAQDADGVEQSCTRSFESDDAASGAAWSASSTFRDSGRSGVVDRGCAPGWAAADEARLGPATV